MSSPIYHFDDLRVIQEIIRCAADESLSVYYTRSTADYKDDGSIVTEADLAMQHSLTTRLAERFPAVHMLGEEVSEAEQLDVIEGEQDYWCLDPVDGTTNFHATMPLFSVSLALVSRGQLVLGIVFDPNRQEYFAALKNQGFWVNGERAERPTQPQHLADCIAFVDFKRLPAPHRVNLVQQAPYKSQRNIGTCALEWAWLAAGRAHLVLHGHERLWDYAAGVLLVEEAGGLSQTFAAEPIFNRSLAPRSVIAASTPELFSQWAERIRSID